MKFDEMMPLLLSGKEITRWGHHTGVIYRDDKLWCLPSRLAQYSWSTLASQYTNEDWELKSDMVNLGSLKFGDKFYFPGISDTIYTKANDSYYILGNFVYKYQYESQVIRVEK